MVLVGRWDREPRGAAVKRKTKFVRLPIRHAVRFVSGDPRAPVSTPGDQTAALFALHGVAGHSPAKGEPLVVVEAKVYAAVEPRHGLLFSDPGERGPICGKEMPERRIERTRAARVP